MRSTSTVAASHAVQALPAIREGATPAIRFGPQFDLLFHDSGKQRHRPTQCPPPGFTATSESELANFGHLYPYKATNPKHTIGTMNPRDMS